MGSTVDHSTKLFSVAEVCNGLYLCGAPALGTDCLSRLGVTCLVSAAPELPCLPLPPHTTRIALDLRDTLSADLTPHLHPIADLINQVCEERGVCLVHCVAGVSRSAALCLGYLVKHGGMSLSEAFCHLRKVRPCVRPNPAFFSQLIGFESQLRGAPSVTMVYNQAANALIPDVYEPDYRNTLSYQQRSCGVK